MKTVTVIIPKGDERREEIRDFLDLQVPDLTVLLVESDLVAEPYVGKVTGNDAAASFVDKLRAELFRFLRGNAVISRDEGIA